MDTVNSGFRAPWLRGSERLVLGWMRGEGASKLGGGGMVMVSGREGEREGKRKRQSVRVWLMAKLSLIGI